MVRKVTIEVLLMVFVFICLYKKISKSSARGEFVVLSSCQEFLWPKIAEQNMFDYSIDFSWSSTGVLEASVKTNPAIWSIKWASPLRLRLSDFKMSFFLRRKPPDPQKSLSWTCESWKAFQGLQKALPHHCGKRKSLTTLWSPEVASRKAWPRYKVQTIRSALLSLKHWIFWLSGHRKDLLTA